VKAEKSINVLILSSMAFPFEFHMDENFGT
jgi:hypothetical protein